MDIKPYDYKFLLERAYGLMKIDKTKISVKPPIIEIRNKKTFIVNFQDFCEAINRNVDDVRKYLESEIQLTTSIIKTGELKIDGMSKHEYCKILQNYVKQNVVCKTCKSIKTTVKKVNKVIYRVCETCLSTSLN